MHTINFNILKDRLHACDRNLVEQKIMICLRSVNPTVSLLVIKYLNMNFLELSYIPLVRALFKFGLDHNGVPLGLDEYGRISILQQANMSYSLSGSHRYTFGFLNGSSDSDVLQWLFNQRKYISMLSKYEVGKQALKFNQYRLSMLIAHYAESLCIDDLFFFNLLVCKQGQKILCRVPNLFSHLLKQDLNKILFSISETFAVIELMLRNDYGIRLLYLDDMKLLKNLDPTGMLLMTQPLVSNETVFYRLLMSSEGFQLLCSDDFFWLKKLNDHQFNDLFYSLLEIDGFDIFIFSRNNPLFLLMLSLFPVGRDWLGLPIKETEDPFGKYLNIIIKEGEFINQSISLWLSSHHVGLRLLEEKYAHATLLTPEVKYKLASMGDRGKALLVKIAKNGSQTDLTSRIAKFSFYQRKENAPENHVTQSKGSDLNN